MARGIRNLTSEQERALYADAKLRDSLSAKGLARKYGTSVRAVRQAIERQRRLECEQVGTLCRMDFGAASV